MTRRFSRPEFQRGPAFNRENTVNTGGVYQREGYGVVM